MKKYKFTINGNTYESSINNVEDNIAEVEVNGSVYKVKVDKELRQQKTPKLVRPAVTAPAAPSAAAPTAAPTSAPAAPQGGGNGIKAPLPGVILDVYVKEGEAVTTGQKLMMLEAMKMENIIEAETDGKVVSISKGKGDSVMEGDVLIVIG